MAKFADIPDFVVYGEDKPSSVLNLELEMLHCEPLVERSRQHNWKINPHRHSGITQLFYLQKGSAEAHLDGVLTHLSPTCVLVVPEGCVHDFVWTPDAEGQVLSIASPLLNRIAQSLEGTTGALKTAEVYIAGAEQSLLDTLFDTIAREYRSRATSRQLMLESCLTTLLVCLSRRDVPETPAPERHDRGQIHYNAFIRLVEEHYSEHWPVSQYAERLGITPPHLNSICRKISQHSALEIVHQRLLLEAKRSLIYTGRSIAEIAYQLGFSDPSHFTRFFKKKSGENPRAFRNGS
jgi:AraC family transcriptional activator of pobA